MLHHKLIYFIAKVLIALRKHSAERNLNFLFCFWCNLKLKFQWKYSSKQILKKDDIIIV